MDRTLGQFSRCKHGTAPGTGPGRDELSARIGLAGLNAAVSATLDEIVDESQRTIVWGIWDEQARLDQREPTRLQ